MYSWLQRLKSLRHGFWYGVSERIRWSRGAFEETPAGELCTVDREQGARIAALRDRYQVQYERRMSAATSFNNYEYLDILDRGWRESQVPRPSGGCFAISAAPVFGTPRPCKPFFTRTAAALLAWRLPLRLLAPERVLRQIHRNLRPQGIFFMVNHGPQEAALAERLCAAAGLLFMARAATSGALSRHRSMPPALSWWTRP